MLFNVLKKKTFKYFNHNVYYSLTNKVWDNIDYTQENWPEGYMLYTTEDPNNKGYAESLVVVCLMKWDDVKQWENTKLHKRGEDYLKFKEQKTKKLLDLVSIKFPQLKEAIDTSYSASPLTFRDYTGTYQGSMYGIVKDCNKPMHTLLSPKTKIPNLHLTGQNISFHGMLGVIMTSLQTCGGIINLKDLYKDISRF
jgi:all-trans-retinol 13,14-reductase